MQRVAEAHGFILGFIVIGAWATICFWATALRLLGYSDTPTFWRAVSLAQILLFLQFLVGLILVGYWAFGSGGAPGGGGWFNWLFHLLYGIGFPLLVLLVGHRMARAGRYEPHSVFAVVGLVIFGLTARAWQVGILGT
jgi:hypothetical protein